MQLRCTQSFSKVVSGGKYLLKEAFSLVQVTKSLLCKTGGAEAANNTFEIVQHETLHQVLYLLKFRTVEMPSQSKQIVPGLSSAVMIPTT
jgi:hypothetical protein